MSLHSTQLLPQLQVYMHDTGYQLLTSEVVILLHLHILLPVIQSVLQTKNRMRTASAINPVTTEIIVITAICTEANTCYR